MSDTGDHMAQGGSPADDDLLAAEYVLGTLPLADRLAVEARLRSHSGLRQMVARWEAHFAALDGLYAEVPAPNLLPAIEARLFPVASRRRLPFWSGLIGGLVAAGLLVTLALQFVPGPQLVVPDLVATLSAEGQAVAFTASYDIETAELTVTRTAGTAPLAGQDYELWVIGASGVPVSLGVMPGDSTNLTLPDLHPDHVLAVSLEAKGGSVTGAPALVLVTGAVTAL